MYLSLFKKGVAGAAWATGISYSFTAVVFLLYFSFNKDGILHFTSNRWNTKLLCTASFNGSSEMVANFSGGIITMIFNLIALKFWGEDGVAAITSILYAEFFFVAVFIGFSLGVAPLFSYTFSEKKYTDYAEIIPLQCDYCCFCIAPDLYGIFFLL